jgi:hypothetical protein
MGISREIVTHYLNQFRPQGYVRYSRKRIAPDCDALAARGTLASPVQQIHSGYEDRDGAVCIDKRRERRTAWLT